MNNIPWKHVLTVAAAFIYGYGMTQSAQGYDTVALHWSWQAVLVGLSMSGLYSAGVVQTPPKQP